MENLPDVILKKYEILNQLSIFINYNCLTLEEQNSISLYHIKNKEKGYNLFLKLYSNMNLNSENL